MPMNKTHKIVAYASAGVLVVALGAGSIVYGSYHTRQVGQISAQVQVANQQAQKANKAKTVVESQLQLQDAKLAKVYDECLLQAKKAKAVDVGASCAD